MTSKKYSFCFLLSFITLIVSVSLVQAGTVKGKVADSASKEGLIGATVYVKDSISIHDGAGLDGSYSIKNLKRGTYILVAQFFGYTTQEKTITISDESQVITIDFQMNEAHINLSNVTITSNYTKESDNYARSEEKNSDILMNVMSAKTIQLLPDLTIGDVLQRVSGVSVEKSTTGGGKYATIRGMDKNYNYTTIDGVQIPSPDYGNRYIPMDLFPAEMVERLEVFKTLTPDMEANAIGGAMNLVLKDAPDRFYLSADFATGFNQTLLNQGYEKFNSSVIQTNSPAQTNGSDYAAKVSDFPTGNINYKDVAVPPNLVAGFTLGDRFLGGRLGILLSANFQNIYSATEGFWIKQQSEPNPGPHPNTPIWDYVSNRDYWEQQTRGAGHLKIDYVFSPKHRMDFYAVYTQMNDIRSRIEQDTANSLPGSEMNPHYQSKVTSQYIFNATLKGKDTLAHNLFLDWTGAYSRAWENIPDWDDISLLGTMGQPTAVFSSLSRVWMQSTDQDFSGYINLSYHFNLFGQKVELKTGAMNRDKTRNAYSNEYDFAATPFQPNYPGIDAILANPSYYVFVNPLGTPMSNNSYSVGEDITAYYGMIKLQLLSKIELAGGMRIENTSQAYVDGESINVVAQNGTKQYTDYLPSVEVKYNITDKQAIHASYFASISRPSFIDIVPYQLSGDQFNQYGNPYLLHTTANNYDLRYEFFPKPSDQILIGVFYKQIYGPIEQAVIHSPSGGPSAVIQQPINIGGDTVPAINYGFEFTITKYIKHFGISANYTYTHSSLVAPELIYRNTVGTGQPKTFDTTETRPIQGQVDNIANLSFIYKNPNIGFEAQLSLVYTGKSVYLIAQYYGLDEWQMPMTTMGFSFQKRLSKKINLSLYGKVNNILNTPLVIRMFPPSNYANIPGTSAWLPNQDNNTSLNSIVVQKEYYGQTYLMGLRYKF